MWCAFVGELGEICIRLPWWGRENGGFSKNQEIQIVLVRFLNYILRNNNEVSF